MVGLWRFKRGNRVVQVPHLWAEDGGGEGDSIFTQGIKRLAGTLESPCGKKARSTESCTCKHDTAQETWGKKFKRGKRGGTKIDIGR